MVSKEIIVNGDPRETRIAVREDGKLVELHIERGERVVGSIFKGRVDNVVAGQDAAFVDIGLERNAYLARETLSRQVSWMKMTHSIAVDVAHAQLSPSKIWFVVIRKYWYR